MIVETSTSQTGKSQGELPITKDERIETLDVLRGFALFGILLINLTAFAAPGGPPGFRYEGSLGNELVVWSLILFVESKFFTLFSFLFGIGFSIQLLRAQERGARFVPLFARRLLGLGLFGVAHIVLMWEGDILLLYAGVGFLLLLFRNASGRLLVRWICVLLLIPLLLFSVGLGVIEVARRRPESAARLKQADAELKTAFMQSSAAAVQHLEQESYGEALIERVRDYRQTFLLLLSRVPSVLAMFLLGLYVGKANILRAVNARLLLLWRARLYGLVLGLTASLAVTLAYVKLEPLSALVALFFNQALAGPLLSMGYAATIVLLMRSPKWQRLFSPLAMTGRMALTNYLLQSLACTLIFNGYGFGLVGKIDPMTGILLVIVIYLLQMAFSTWWLRRFRFGPAEWLWRSFTYLRLQSLAIDGAES